MTVLAAFNSNSNSNNNNRHRRSPSVLFFTRASTIVMLSLLSTTMRGRFGGVVVVQAWTAASSSFSTVNTMRQQKQKQTSRQPLRLFSSASATASTDNENNKDNVVKVPAKFVSYPFSYRQEVDIRIETLTNRGWGIGRVPLEIKVDENSNENKDNKDDEPPSEASASNNNSKWVIMVPNVIIGELVKVRVFRNYNSYSEADVAEILEPSPDRVQPLCPLAEECGGCQLQHMNIESQRQWKTAFVQQGLAEYPILTTTEAVAGNNGVEIVVEPCLGTDEIYGYRSKLTPHYQAPAKRKRGEQLQPKHNTIDAIGFQKQTSRQILDVPACPIATPAINRRLTQLRNDLLLGPVQSKKGATLLLRQANVDVDDSVEQETVTVDHKTYLTTRVRGLEFSYLAGNFFQNNLYVLPLMVDHVVEHAATIGTESTDSTTNTKMTHLVDCYCGSGLFAISAAANADCDFETIVGIEINDKAVLEATNNAIKNNVSSKCRFVAATAEGIFDQIQDFPRDTTCTILDPPRKGCSEEFLEQLYQFGPRKIVYMSCDPTTQARDAAGMVAAGYTITKVLPFDLFPQTRHIECLMILERNNI
jgi:tRNA (uracil-5-)-methyltransferase